jgi:cytoplasmic FMR1 interacting protein
LTLYAFRSTGKAIPHVQSQDQENKMLVYEKTCEVLKPEIYRMITLMDFRDKLVSAFSESLTAIIPDMKDRELFPSEAFLLALAELFDLTVSLDTMKNFKGSMTNDLSMYKRYNLLRQFKKYADKRSVRPRAYGTPKA